VPDTSIYHFKELQELMDKGGYLSTIDELNSIQKKYPKSYQTALLLGKCYSSLKRFDLAEEQFQKLPSLASKKKDPMGLYYLAFSQYRQGKMKESLVTIAKFESSRPPFNAGIWADIKLIKAAATTAKKANGRSGEYSMDTTFAFPNSAYADFSPYSFGDTAFLFSSLRHDSLVNFTEGQANFNTIQLYYYKVKPDGQFDEINLVKNLNVPGYHNGNGCFSSDGKRFFFSRCTDGSKGKLSCAIYEAVVNSDGSFHKIRKLSDRINKRKYNSRQPHFITLTANGQPQDYLYFVSNRKGGFGKDDIWFSAYNRKKKRFSSPQNAGFQINSAGNEGSPFFDAKGSQFYYSSDGFPGFGGKDVFQAKANGIQLSNRELLNEPINSIGDDHFFVLMPDGSSGYMASNRKGANLLDQKYCCEDVFRFYKTDTERIPMGTASNTVQPVIELVQLVKEKRDTIPTEPTPTKLLEIPIERMASKPVQTSLQSTVSTEKTINGISSLSLSRKIYFDNNAFILTKKSQKQASQILLEIKKQKPALVIISGFADRKGDTQHNARLAERRAKAVLSIFRKQGLSIPMQMKKRNLNESLNTQDAEMLSLDRYVEITWRTMSDE